MQLIGQKSVKYKDKVYWKHWVIIPKRLLEKLGWKKGEKLKAEVKDQVLIVKKLGDET